MPWTSRQPLPSPSSMPLLQGPPPRRTLSCWGATRGDALSWVREVSPKRHTPCQRGAPGGTSSPSRCGTRSWRLGPPSQHTTLPRLDRAITSLHWYWPAGWAAAAFGSGRRRPAWRRCTRRRWLRSLRYREQFATARPGRSPHSPCLPMGSPGMSGTTTSQVLPSGARVSGGAAASSQPPSSMLSPTRRSSSPAPRRQLGTVTDTSTGPGLGGGKGVAAGGRPPS